LKFLAPFNTRRYRYQKSVKENKKKASFFTQEIGQYEAKKKNDKNGRQSAGITKQEIGNNKTHFVEIYNFLSFFFLRRR
jgi:hypothetical protein